MWPFTFEATGMCVCAVGAMLWTDMLTEARNIISAALYAWMVLLCFVAMFVFAVRWVQLP